MKQWGAQFFLERLGFPLTFAISGCNFAQCQGNTGLRDRGELPKQVRKQDLAKETSADTSPLWKSTAPTS
jgi:hypothetical protein